MSAYVLNGIYHVSRELAPLKNLWASSIAMQHSKVYTVQGLAYDYRFNNGCPKSLMRPHSAK